MKYYRGFSVIEMLVVMSLVIVIGVVLIANFRSPSLGATGRHQVSSVVVSDLRRMQSLSLAGSVYKPATGPVIPTCGYGIHYVDATHYLLFTRPFVSTPCATMATRFYGTDDRIIETRTIANPKMLFTELFLDIYYSIPYASVFIGGKPLTPTEVPSTQIGIYTPVRAEVGDITYITIGASGNIDINN